jgi:hypothetical protein
MVTVRTYWGPVEAGLAKSLLDDHEIFCVLADEDTNRYSGAPFAVPIRLRVHEDRADQAIRILSGDLEGAAEIDEGLDATPLATDSEIVDNVVDNNPWELLAIAFLFFVPGFCVLQTKYPAVVATSSRIRREIAAVTVIHFLGWLAIGFAAFLIATYFRVRRSSLKLQN